MGKNDTLFKDHKSLKNHTLYRTYLYRPYMVVWEYPPPPPEGKGNNVFATGKCKLHSLIAFSVIIMLESSIAKEIDKIVNLQICLP